MKQSSQQHQPNQSPSIELDKVSLARLEGIVSGDQLTDLDKWFLLETSVLEVLTDSCCSALVETGIPLRELRRRCPSLEAIDRNGNSFRIPIRVRRELQRVLLEHWSADRLADHHLKAALALQELGNLDAAIDHLILSGQPRAAADLLAEQHGSGIKPASIEDLRRFDAPELDDYVPHLLTVGLVHAESKNYPVAELMLIQLDGADWTGPLPHGYANLEEGIVALSLLRPGSGREKLEAVLEATPGYENAGERHHLTDRYRSAHYQYYLEDFVAARELSDEVLLGHRAVGRESLHDQAATVLACVLQVTIHHEHGNVVEARVGLRHVQELVAEYALPRTFAVINDVIDLNNAVVADHAPAIRVHLLSRLFQQGSRPELQIQAGIELVRSCDQNGNPEEARRVLKQLGVFCEGREISPLIETRLAALRVALEDSGTRRRARSLALTPAERVVLLLLVDESLSQIDISENLGLSTNTIKSHVRSIHQKLGTTSRSETVEKAAELGLLATILPWLQKRVGPGNS